MSTVKTTTSQRAGIIAGALKEIGLPRAAAYLRVSTEEQKKNYSIGTQQEACLKTAEERGYEITTTDIFTDDYSAFYLSEREGLNRLRAEVRAGKYQAVICHALDRLTREQAHLYIIVEEFQRHGCDLIFVTEKLDDSPQGKLLRSVHSFMAEVERLKILERTMRGKRARAESGKVPSFGGELYGYRKDKKNGVRVPYEPEADVVRRIFNMIAEGNSAHYVLHVLNDEGIPPPGVNRKYKDKVARLGLWKTSSILRIIHNSAYKGEEYAWKGMWERKGGKRYLRVRDAAQQIKLPPSACPALVTPEVWQRVQEVIENNRRGAGAIRTRNQRKPHLLRGLITCMQCGSPMYPTIGGGRKSNRPRLYRYRCRSMFLDKTHNTCTGKSVAAPDIEAYAWDAVVESMRRPELIERKLTEAINQLDSENLAADLESHEKQLEAIERGQNNYIKMLGKASDDLAEKIQQELMLLDKRRARVLADIEKLKARMRKHTIKRERVRAITEFCGSVVEALDSFSFEEKRELLESVNLRGQADGEDWDVTWEIPAGESEADGVVSFHISRRSSRAPIFTSGFKSSYASPPGTSRSAAGWAR